MDEGRERDNTSRRGGVPTLPSPQYMYSVAQSITQYNSAFATRVLQSTCVCVKGERACVRIFKLFRTPGINSKELVDWFQVCSFVVATYAGGNVSLEIFALLKSLKIRALENLTLSVTSHFHWILVV
jgi:hypothetical protein